MSTKLSYLLTMHCISPSQTLLQLCRWLQACRLHVLPCRSVCTKLCTALSLGGTLLSRTLHTSTSGHSSAALQWLYMRQHLPHVHCHTCRWLTQLLRTSRLDALMVKHVEMSTEIKSLDSDMQMLVYENYNKFISATDTIRSMKSNVDGMDSNMHELKGLIGQWVAGNVVLDCALRALSCNLCVHPMLHVQLQGDCGPGSCR